MSEENGDCGKLELNNLNFISGAPLLSRGQHKILLGILKKIEAKSAAFSVVASLAITLFFQGYSVLASVSVAASLLLMCATGSAISILLATADASLHRGQHEFSSKIHEKVGCEKFELQLNLIEDMLKKERALDIAFNVSIVMMVFVLLSFVASVLPQYFQIDRSNVNAGYTNLLFCGSQELHVSSNVLGACKGYGDVKSSLFLISSL